MELNVIDAASRVGYGGAPFGVLLAQLGGPTDVRAVRPYLYRLFLDTHAIPAGRLLHAPLAHLLTLFYARRLQRKMKRMGGRSPILQHAANQAKGVEKRLRLRGRDAHVRFATRYLQPDIETALVDLHDAGLRRLIVVALHPQSATTTTAAILQELDQAILRSGCTFRSVVVAPWYAENSYLELMARRLQAELTELTNDLPTGEQVQVLFCARSVAEPLVPEDQYYLEQVDATVEGIMSRLPHAVPRSLAYHAGQGLLRWVGPRPEQAVADLAAQGARHVLCAPLLVGDHVETLYDIDVALQRIAARSGIDTVRRVPALNDHPEFLDLLTQLIERKLDA